MSRMTVYRLSICKDGGVGQAARLDSAPSAYAEDLRKGS